MIKEAKELTAFTKSPASPGGLVAWCKACSKAAKDERTRQFSIGERLYLVVTEKTCSVCKATRPVMAFAKSTESRDGLRARCKACHKAANVERARKRRDRAIPRRDVIEKSCRRCHTAFPPIAFSKQAASPDGLHPWCKTCCKDVMDERKHKLKTGETPYLVLTKKFCPST